MGFLNTGFTTEITEITEFTERMKD